MKNFLLFMLFIGPVAATECCEEEDDEECRPKYNYIEVDHSYLRDEASWPTKNEDPFVEALKN